MTASNERANRGGLYRGSLDTTVRQGWHRKISMAGRSPDIGIVLIRTIGASH
jgi:hypothetical protein